MTTKEAQYIIANELGHGSGGGNAWNNGITVELKGCDGLRRIVMQPHNNNSASSETLGITTDLSIIKYLYFAQYLIISTILFSIILDYEFQRLLNTHCAHGENSFELLEYAKDEYKVDEECIGPKELCR